MVVIAPKKLTEQLIVWDAVNNSAQNTQCLEQIVQWWVGLDNTAVRWNGWFLPCMSNPMLVKQLIIKEPQCHGSKLSWRLDESPGAFSLTPSRMVLDPVFQTLDIIITTENFNRRLEQKHRVEMVNSGNWGDRRHWFPSESA